MRKSKRMLEGLTPLQKIALYGIGGYIIYRGLYKFFGRDYSGGTSENITPGTNLTYAPEQYQVWADEFESAIWGTWALPAWTEDDELMGNILMTARTIDDVYALIAAYGVRERGVLFKDGGNLAQTVRAYLDDDIKQAVNAYYQSSGINFTWQ